MGNPFSTLHSASDAIISPQRPVDNLGNELSIQFLSLPPELRVEIYRYLLLRPNGFSLVQASNLRLTSHQVCAEINHEIVQYHRRYLRQLQKDLGKSVTSIVLPKTFVETRYLRLTADRLQSSFLFDHGERQTEIAYKVWATVNTEILTKYLSRTQMQYKTVILELAVRENRRPWASSMPLPPRASTHALTALWNGLQGWSKFWHIIHCCQQFRVIELRFPSSIANCTPESASYGLVELEDEGRTLRFTKLF